MQKVQQDAVTDAIQRGSTHVYSLSPVEICPPVKVKSGTTAASASEDQNKLVQAPTVGISTRNGTRHFPLVTGTSGLINRPFFKHHVNHDM